MRCTFLHDFCFPPHWQGDRSAALSREVPDGGPFIDPRVAKKRVQWYLPKGTTAECPQAPFYCNRGLARPADDECTAASIPYTDEERAAVELEYCADLAGIIPEDRDKFRKGVILGYRQRKDGKLVFIPGPNWLTHKQQQQAAKQAAAANDEGI